MKSIIIGITGGIATGKSCVTNYLRTNNYTVLDADEYAHLAYEDDEIKKEIQNHFHTLDRKEIGQIVFHNEKEKEYLESLIHPFVKKQILSHMSEFTFIDVPLLYESGFDSLCDQVIVVSCEKKIEIERLMKRNQLSYEEAIHRISLQMSLKEKEKRADYIIDNSGSLESLYKKVDQVIEEIKNDL